MDHLTSVGTINASNFVRAVIQPDGMGAIHFLMPVTDFEYNGQPVTPPGFDKEYGLYLTLDGTNIGHPDGSVDFTSLNVTLWADPGNDAGTPSVSETSDPAFTNGTANDIVLATGTLVSGSMSLDPTTNTRHADLVEQLTPTLDGTYSSMAPSSQEPCWKNKQPRRLWVCLSPPTLLPRTVARPSQR